MILRKPRTGVLTICLAVLLSGCVAAERHTGSVPVVQNVVTGDYSITVPRLHLRAIPENQHVLALVGIVIPFIPLWYGDAKGNLAWIIIEATPEDGILTYAPMETALFVRGVDYAPAGFTGPVPAGDECNKLSRSALKQMQSRFTIPEAMCLGIAFQLPHSVSLDEPFALTIGEIRVDDQPVAISPTPFQNKAVWNFHFM